MKSHEQVASQKETASTPLTNWRCFACTNTRKGTAVIVSQVGTSLIRTLDKGNCQNEFDHDNWAHILFAVRSSISLRSVEFSFKPKRPTYQRRRLRRSQLTRVNPVTLKRTSYCLHSTCAQMNQNIQCTKVNQTFELFSFTKNGTKLAARNATAKAKSRARKNELMTAQIFSLWRKQNTQRT